MELNEACVLHPSLWRLLWKWTKLGSIGWPVYEENQHRMDGVWGRVGRNMRTSDLLLLKALGKLVQRAHLLAEVPDM